MTDPSLADLVAAFRSRTLPKERWTHLAHLRVGAWHVHHFGAEAALGMLRTRIQRLNEAHGTVNSSTSGYHETITVAYVRLIEQFLAAGEGDVLESPLAERAVLLRFWSQDLLMSARARAEWVPPDVAPLSLPRRR